jgi:chloramphenicol O-acetyltransferase type A
MESLNFYSNMKHKLELDSWNRRDHFEFFRKFEEPYFGICVDVDCTETFEECKANERSFFLRYLHKSLTAANGIESFRYRITDNEVFVHDIINASPTIGRPDGTFGFSYMDYNSDFSTFEKHAKQVIENIQAGTGLNPALSGENVIHYSSLPWLKFTALSHARSLSQPDSCPKISFGKVTQEHGRWTMPMSVHVHHALADGYDVGLYVAAFQKLLNNS